MVQVWPSRSGAFKETCSSRRSITGAIVDVATFLKEDDRLRFKHLNNLCGVDYLEPDPKKAAKFGHDPHVELVRRRRGRNPATHRHRDLLAPDDAVVSMIG